MKFIAPSPKIVENAFNLALFALREQALTDCNYYVRKHIGTLGDTAFTRVDGMTLSVIWDQPYARRVYYTGTPSTDKNPNASLMWAEKAAAQFKGDWQKILQKGLKDNL